MDIKRLADLIDGKKTTKAKVVRDTGISRPSLDSILSGNDFKVSNLEKIAKSLNVNVGYFFDEESIEVTEHRAGRDLVVKGKIEHKGTEYNGAAPDAVLEERVRSLETLVAEKDERIRELKERIDELKAR